MTIITGWNEGRRVQAGIRCHCGINNYKSWRFDLKIPRQIPYFSIRDSDNIIDRFRIITFDDNWFYKDKI